MDRDFSILILAACAALSPAQVQTEIDQIGISRNGTPIEVFTVAAPGLMEPDTRPALLIVAGVEPEHRIGVDVAKALTQRDWSEQADLLSTHTIYVIPVLNPDGMTWLEGGSGPIAELGRTDAPFDADRDGRLGEDPPDDLNGDGLITEMRVYDPPARYGLDLNLVPESDDPRLARAPKAAEGETGQFTIVSEGLDNDGDGRFNEDGRGGPGSGVNLDNNFPTHFPEFREGAGFRPVSEPETRAIIDWMLDHRNITGVIIFGRGDTMLNKPPAGKFDQTNRIPKGIEKGDLPYFEHFIKSYKDTTSLESAPKPNYDGSFYSWAYAEFGAWTFESAVWSRPKVDLKKDEDKPEAEEDGGDEPEINSAATERQKLIEQGVPEEIARFITGTPEERQAMADDFNSLSDAERQAKMEAVGSLPPAIQARMMAAIQQTAAGQAGGEPEVASKKPSTPIKPNNSDDGKWLTYSDEQRDGEGFVEWTPFDHPQLGRVEIGGFVPGFRINPPDGLVESLADEQTGFAISVLESLPNVEVGQVHVEQVGPGLWRLRVEICNPGYLPTATQVGLKIREPITVDLLVDKERIVSGSKMARFNRLMGSGDCEQVEWLLSGTRGETVEIQVRSARFATRSVQVRLEGGQP